MKKEIALLKMTVLFFCLMTRAVFGIEGDIKIQRVPEKLYIDPQTIQIVDNNIVVYFSNNWVATNAIHSDSNGVYIQSDSFLGFWTCSRCGFVNPAWNFVCDNCKLPR